MSWKLRQEPSGLSLLDVVDQSRLAVMSRPGRSLATALGTVVGVAAVIATVGISSTASAQVSEQFDALRATLVTVEATAADAPPSAADDQLFSVDGVARLRALNGVDHAGVAWTAPAITVKVVPPYLAERPAIMPMMAAQPETLAALHASIGQGRQYDEFHESERQPVALLGRAAATRRWSL